MCICIHVYAYICTYMFIYIYIYIQVCIYVFGQACRMFTKGSREWILITHQIIPKTQKLVLNTSLLDTLHYKVCIKDKMDQFREKSCPHPYTFV